MLIENYERYLRSNFKLEVFEQVGNRVKEGELISLKDGAKHSITEFIPRFVPVDNYCNNFGLQWNHFRKSQLDSQNLHMHSFTRFWTSCGLKPKDLNGKKVLEAGSGAGRFTEILLDAGAKVVSFDFSNAVEANYKNNDDPDLFLFQGDIYNIPLEKHSFDFVICYGVLQHTPRPYEAFVNLLEYLKPGGIFSIDHYRTFLWPNAWFHPKYIWRPITSRMDPEKLLKIVQFYIPIWLPFDTVIKKIPKLGMFLSGLIPIPCWNYLNLGLSYRQRLEWAVMDTFDALGAVYDKPLALKHIQKWCSLPELTDVAVSYGGNGIVANGTKKRPKIER